MNRSESLDGSDELIVADTERNVVGRGLALAQ
jgi:hypothetical protein